MTIKYIDEIDLNCKRVLVKVDYNVPYNEKMEITDETRITSTLPTINYCLQNNAKIILVSHLGRPKGKKVKEMSLRPVKERLSEIIKKEIMFYDSEINEDTVNLTEEMKAGDILLLENIRFFPEEEKNDDDFGKKLASLTDVYVNDAFAVSHRGHASNDSITRHIKECCAGFLLKKEIEYFNKAIDNPERPLGALIGGAKVSGKLEVLNNIVEKVDFLIIGGGMAFTFLRAKGFSTGKSLMEEELIDDAAEIMKTAESKGKNILLPIDIVAAEEFDNESPQTVVRVSSIPDNLMGLDIGPETIKLFSSKIMDSKTIIWNGPMGAFEMPNFSNGTNKIAETIADTNCLSIIGGGDSVTAVNKAGIADRISYISTGGGAFLDLMGGKTLPALKALDRCKC
jgi:3-phosphoglycerate kinase